jgi:rhodanese-related sulfurtransferase
MKTRILQALVIVIAAVFVGLLFNGISGRGIPMVGKWPSNSGSDSVIVPPSAEEGDPSFISLAEAAALYQMPETMFIDAREPEDFEYGHINGAISLPYDYMEDYWDILIAGIAKDRNIVIYCSGSECESSLFLGRELVFNGFKNIFVFYGGWREWEKTGLSVVKAQQDDDI